MVSEYMLRILKERNVPSNNSMIQQQIGSASISPSTVETLSAIDFTRILNLYHNKNYSGSGQPPFSPPPSHSPLVSVNSPEPQREALDLANSTHR